MKSRKEEEKDYQEDNHKVKQIQEEKEEGRISEANKRKVYSRGGGDRTRRNKEWS